MKSLPKISIIIPVYNVEPYIAECVQSVMRQTYKGEIECILVDDCGTDNSIEIAERLINNYNDEMNRADALNEPLTLNGVISFLILHHEHNRGLSAARNTGTDAATGDYIYYLDSDDYISDDCIEVLTQPLQEYIYDMVIGGMKPFGGDFDISPIPLPSGALLSNTAIIESFYGAEQIYAMAWNRLVKRNLFQKYDLTFLEGQLHEDELWKYKCCRVLTSLYVQNIVTYYYRVRKDGIMGTRLNNIDKLTNSFYASIDYVLSHPMKNISRDIWDRIVITYANDYLYALIQPFHNSHSQYISMRRRIDYQPLNYWRKGQMSIKDIKHQLHFVLPPFFGYVYLKVRKLKQILLS